MLEGFGPSIVNSIVPFPDLPAPRFKMRFFHLIFLLSSMLTLSSAFPGEPPKCGQLCTAEFCGKPENAQADCAATM